MSEEINSGAAQALPAYPCLARVVSNIDPTYMGVLEVSLIRPGAGNNDSATQIQQVEMMTSFFGSTGFDYIAEDPNDYNNTQKSYGMWFCPPDVGTTVLVIFVNGDPSRGYWIGCVPDAFMNFSVPGLAATEAFVAGDADDYESKPTRLPVAEYNKAVSENNTEGSKTKLKKPKHLIADILESQGLLLDDIRGITSSSARREAPSMVFGISTPGPLDKRPGSKRGPVGKLESQFPNAFVSRLGGTTFVMDDGDAAFQRKTKPGGGPDADPPVGGPEYASVENDEEGLPDVPHNELVRIRTRTGHQFLMHNSEDLIYITNSRGTSWIEFTSDGKIDIYAQDSISIHTEQDFNLFAERDINIEAGRNFNTKVGTNVLKADVGEGFGEMHTHVLGNQILIVEKDQLINVQKDVFVTYEGLFKHRIVGDTNVTLDANLNVTIIGDYNLNTQGANKFTSTANTEIFSGAATVITTADGLDVNTGTDNNFTAGGNTGIKSGGNHVETAARIDMNGPAAPVAAKTVAADIAVKIEANEYPKRLVTHATPRHAPVDTSEATNAEKEEEYFRSIMRRIPTTEPYPQHENLDPLAYYEDKTDRDLDGRYGEYVIKFKKLSADVPPDETATTVPQEVMAIDVTNIDKPQDKSTSDTISMPAELWKKYSTLSDTFNPTKPASGE
jgi:hypothetical protein